MKFVEEEINLFLETWDYMKMKKFFEMISPLVDLYEVDENEDWLEEQVGKENRDNVRLIQTVYLMSKIVEDFSQPFCKLKMDHPKLWKRMEKEVSTKN
jgi:hypothetical protein